MPYKHILLLGFLVISSVCKINAQENYPLFADDIVAQRTWVDSIYQAMTPKERVGQLFMVDVFSSDPKSKTDKIKKLVEEEHIGGLIFSKGTPEKQAKLNNELQEVAKTKLLVGMDAEWGLAMRLENTYAFPWNMTLGAIPDNKIVKKVGKRIGEHSKRLGVHINFCLLYTSPSPRDLSTSRMPSSA